MTGTLTARARLALLSLALVAAAVGASAPAAGAGITEAPCFGAASRDPARPCQNPDLRRVVVPSPAEARSVPPADCRVAYRSRILFVCGWGDEPAQAGRTVALIGDSHAAHWRPAIEAVIRHRGWRAVSMSRAGCPLTEAYAKLPTVARSNSCRRWNRAVRAWLGRHPEVSVVFVAQHRIKVVPRRGLGQNATVTAGYRQAWESLLARNVKRVIVLRETPRDTPGTLACVAGAMAAGRPAGPACAVPRRYALPPDPAVAAARGMRSARVQVADFTNVFCSARLCLPVIGGALVHRDTEHMNRQFVASLGPLMVAKVDRLAASWRDPSRKADAFQQDGGAPKPLGIIHPPGRPAT
ncbi:O-antigen acetylase [Paraconexibacter sp. AEG42_29]|uniref:O-antigen acetylase n=1 Tax=Paraconexibacter sp. AEG42_29 TaxID=2997339 RepID=A0AAU7B3I0_9ACTN